MTPTCARCERELADGAYVCDRPCAERLARDLAEAAGHADDAPNVVARQVRYGPGGGRANERPLPFDVRASEDLWAAENTIGTWARHVAEERGIAPFEPPPPTLGPLCAQGDLSKCPHGSCDAIKRPYPNPTMGELILWISGQLNWLRHRPEAAEAFDELDDACRMLRRLVDRPADRVLVGMCDCGRVLYAPADREQVVCPECAAEWDVETSRWNLRDRLDERLVIAADAARLAGYLGTDRTQEQLRKLVTKWGERGEIPIRDSVWRKPTPGEIQAAKDEGEEPPAAIAVPVYRFGDVAERLARTPRRERRMAA